MTRFAFARLTSTALAAAMLSLAAVPSMAQNAEGAVPIPPPPPAAAERHHPPAPGERREAMRRHIEAVKQRLQLTPEQEPAWSAFVESMRPGQPPRAPEAAAAPADLARMTTPERIDRLRAMRARHAAEADRRGEAIKTFYAALTPAQKKVFDDETARMFERGPWGKRMHDGPRGPRHDDRHHRHGPRAGQPTPPPPPIAPAPAAQ